MRGVAQFGRALGSGPRGRQFKSVRPDHPMKKQAHVFYTGRVQGVGFRFTAIDIARELKVCGWVKNLSDARVELTAEAEEYKLKDFLSQLNNFFAPYIQEADINWQAATGEFKDFTIEF